eukprot:scaffold11728_cov32-Tisochrysis_lutea.AAC.3
MAVIIRSFLSRCLFTDVACFARLWILQSLAVAPGPCSATLQRSGSCFEACMCMAMKKVAGARQEQQFTN